MARTVFRKDSIAPVTRPVPRVDQGGGVVNWLGGGGGDARHRLSVDLEGSGGMLPQKSFYKFDMDMNGVSFCILKYKSLVKTCENDVQVARGS